MEFSFHVQSGSDAVEGQDAIHPCQVARTTRSHDTSHYMTTSIVHELGALRQDSRHEPMHSIVPVDYEKRMRVNRAWPIMPRHDKREWAATVQSETDPRSGGSSPQGRWRPRPRRDRTQKRPWDLAHR